MSCIPQYISLPYARIECDTYGVAYKQLILIHPLCRYPQYVVHCDAQSSLLANNKSYTRYSTESLYGVAFDVFTLSQCDYLVCTFSSQVSESTVVLSM